MRARHALPIPVVPPDLGPAVADAWRRLAKASRLVGNRRFRRGLRHGVGAAIEHRHLRWIGARSVIDVGAHRGQFSLLALELFPSASIIAFEPLSGACEGLARLMRDESRLRLYPMALGCEAGTRPLLVAQRDDCSSLRAATGAQMEIEPRSRSVRSEQVPVARLDEVLRPEQLRAPALLKIDVQGHELEVLEGARGLLERLDVVFLEASFRELYAGQVLAGEVIAWLAGRGFTLNGVYNLVLDDDGRAVQADLEFGRAAPGEAALADHREPR